MKTRWFLSVIAMVLVQLALERRVWGQFEYFVPQVVDGQNEPLTSDAFRTIFQFVNLSGETALVRLRVEPDGEFPFDRLIPPSPVPRGGGEPEVEFSIPPLGAAQTETLRGPFSIVGWARIESTQPLGVVVVLQYVEAGTERVIASTSVLPDPLTEAFSTYATIGRGRSLGLALLNPSTAASATVDIQLRRIDGQLEATRQIALEPGEKIAQFFNQGELFTDLEVFQGSAEFRSTAPLAVMTIQVDGENWSASRVLPPRGQ